VRLRTRFAVALVVVAVVLSVTTLVGFAFYRDAIVAQERTELSRTSESVAGQLEVVLDEKRGTVRLWSRNPAVSDHGTGRQDAALGTFVRNTGFSGASVMRANGTMSAMESRGLDERNEQTLVGRSFADRSYFQRAIEGETFVSDPVDAESGTLIVTVSTPLVERGETVGTLNAALHVREGDLSSIVEGRSSGTRGAWVFSGDRTVLAGGPSPTATDAELTANATVGSTGWTVTATTTGGSLSSRLWTVTMLQAGAFVLVLLCLAAFGGWLYRESVHNVERLLGGFDALVAGDYGSPIALSGATEWDRVDDQFNDLSETLAQRRSEVTVLNRVLRHNLRNAMTVVVGNADRIEARTDDGAIAADARRIRHRGESLLDLAEHARTLDSSFGAHDDEAAARPVRDVVEEAIAVVADEYPNATLTFDVNLDGDTGTAPAGSEVRVPSGDLVVVVLDELLRNGIVHNDGDQPVVDLTVSADPDTVRLAVSDDGPGLPPVERRVLTGSIVETETQHGSGLGLWLVSWLVARVDGKVAVSTVDGTTVTLTIPRVRAGDSPAARSGGVDVPGAKR
jgi:signal transduction histidine kinase